MEKEVKKIIFTDLDGTLLDKETYSFDKAKSALQLIKKTKTPLIITTSKTRAEIEYYRKKLNNKHPFISENGGAIFIPKNYFSFKIKVKKNKVRKKKDYLVIEIGTPYKKLKKVMKRIDKKYKITSFYELTPEQLAKQTGLSLSQAKKAQQREYDAVFKIDNMEDKWKILSIIKKKGYHYTEGGRYFHITGNNDKGKAVKILVKLYEKFYKKRFGKNTKIETLGFGDAKNDKPLFDITDKDYLVLKVEQWNKIILRELK